LPEEKQEFKKEKALRPSGGFFYYAALPETALKGRLQIPFALT